MIKYQKPVKSFGLILNSMIVASVVTNLDNAMVEDDEAGSHLLNFVQ